MADQPSVDPSRVGLDVELDSEQTWSPPESLERAMRRESEGLAALREVEIVAVPVQHVDILQMPQLARPPPSVSTSARSRSH